MPTNVKPHLSHTKRGQPERVRGYTRYGPEHTPQWRRLVADLKRKGEVASPEAVATKTLGYRGTFGPNYHPLTQPRTGRWVGRSGSAKRGSRT